MRNSSTISVVTILLSALALGTAMGQHLDFSGFDSSVLSTGGGSQTFTDICGDIDVTVTANGNFDATVMYSASMDGAISSQHDGDSAMEEHSFTFCFSSPFDVNVETYSLDGLEEFEVSSEGVETYVHGNGTRPTVTSTSEGLLLDGNGFGQGPSGASDGYVNIDAPSSGPFCVTVTYRTDPSLGITKYGSFAISKGAVVPEPNSAALVGVGMLLCCGRIRRRR